MALRVREAKNPKTAKRLQQTHIFRLLDALTKEALTTHFKAESLQAHGASILSDANRLHRIDETIQVAVNLAADLLGCVRYKPRADRYDAKRDPRDWLAGETDPSGIQDGPDLKEFDRSDIEDITRRYLTGSYRSADFDVALIRTLIGMEVYGFAAVLKAKRYMERKFDYAIFIFIAIAIGVAMLVVLASLGIGIRYAILAAYDAKLLGDWAPHVADVLAGAFALACFQTIGGIPVSIFKKYFGKPSEGNLLQKMYSTYFEVPEDAPISTERVRQLLNAAAADGAVWPAPLFALLDDIDRRPSRAV